MYATHSHILKRQPSGLIAPRLAGYGVYAKTVDGNDGEAVYTEMLEMVSRVHIGGPFFLEAETYRLKEHWGPGEDWHLGYRSEAEGDEWKERCPIKQLRDKLFASGVMETTLDAFTDQIDDEIIDAVRFAKESPEPGEEELLTW